MPNPPKKRAKKPTKNNKFWGAWSQCIKLFKSANMSDHEIEEERQAMLKLTGARPDSKGRYSMTSLTNDQLSTALDFMNTTILGNKNEKRRSKSKIWAIEQLGISDDDLNDVARDTWRKNDWRKLTHDQLCKFQMTAKRIAADRKKKAQS